jgi:invasion protein IalB
MNKLTERLVVGGATLVVGLVLGWAIRGVATYNTATETMTSFQDWHTACPAASAKGNPSCQMVEDVLDSKTKAPMVHLIIGRDNGHMTLGMTLPYGVALEAGVGLALGSEPVKVVHYRTCNNVGCVATIPFEGKLKDSFESAKEGRILIAGLDGKPVAFPLSFDGYADAARAFKRSEAKRNSWFWRMWS